MNSRNKGKRGEREFAALLSEHGYSARRGQQYSGSPESPDVVSPALPWLHVEVKRVQNLNLADACTQAEGDSAGKPWIVAHRRNHAPWLITMRAELLFRLLRGDVPEMQGEHPTFNIQHPTSNEGKITDGTLRRSTGGTMEGRQIWRRHVPLASY